MLLRLLSFLSGNQKISMGSSIDHRYPFPQSANKLEDADGVLTGALSSIQTRTH